MTSRMSAGMLIVLAGGVAGAAGAAFVVRWLPETGGHGPWFASRAAGIAAYLMAWVAIMSGILGSTGALDGLVNRARLMAIHQSASVTSVGLALFHAVILLRDEFIGFGLADVLVPWASNYERTAVAGGIASLYLLSLVMASFWFRRVIGMRTWRAIHLASLIAFTGALWHGLALGTDSEETWVLGMYILTSSTVAGALALRTVTPGPQARAAKRTKAVTPG